MAEAGDFEKIWRLLAATPVSGWEFAQRCRQLSLALEVASAADPEALVDVVTKRMLAVIANMIVRAQLKLQHQLDEHAQQAQMTGQMPIDGSDGMLQRLKDLQGHFVGLAQSRANCRRLQLLMQEKRLKNARLKCQLRCRNSRKVNSAQPREAKNKRQREAGAKHDSTKVYTQSDGQMTQGPPANGAGHPVPGE